MDVHCKLMKLFFFPGILEQTGAFTNISTHQQSHINCYFSIHGKKLNIQFKQTDLLLFTADQVAKLTKRALDKFKRIQAKCHLQGKVPPSEVSIPLPSSMFNRAEVHSDHTYCSTEHNSPNKPDNSTSDKGKYL